MDSRIVASAEVLDFDEAIKGHIAQAMAKIQAAMGDLERILATDIGTNDVARVFYRSRLLHDVMDETRKRLSDKIRRLSEETIPQLFLNEGVSSVNLVDVGRVTVSYRVSASMPDKVAGFNWLRKNKHGDLITETVNAQSLGKFCDMEFLDNNVEPPDVFKVSKSPYTSITAKG